MGCHIQKLFSSASVGLSDAINSNVPHPGQHLFFRKANSHRHFGHWQCAYRELRPYHPASLWHANLAEALSLLASTSESKDWQSLPRPVVECIQVQGVRVAKESGSD